MFIRNRWLMGIVAIMAVAMLLACGGPEEKKLKFYNKGKALFEKGDYVKAKLELKNALQIDPKYADAYYMFGMVALRTQDFKGAYGNFLKVVELSPQNWEAHTQLGRLLLAGGRPDDALAKADLVIKNNPKSEDALVLKASVLLVKKDIAGARRLLEDNIGRTLGKPDGYLLLAAIYSQEQNKQKIENILQKGLAANPKSIPLHLAFVDYYLKSKNNEEAIKMMQKVIEIEPKVDKHRLALAGIYWYGAKEPQAVEVLKALIADDPKKEERWAEVAKFYLQRNKVADAERELKEGIQKNEKSFMLRFALSDFYLNTNRPDLAIALLQECLKINKDAGDQNVISAKNALAKIYLARREIDKAKTYVDEIIKESPKNVDAQYTKGTIHLMKGEGGDAVASFRVVVGERPQFIPGYVSLASAHRINKEMNLAFDTIQKALKNAPKSRDLIRALAQLYVAQKDVKNAEVQYRKLLEANANDLEIRAELGDVLLASGDARRAEAEYSDIKRRAPKSPLGYLKLSAFYMSQQKADRAVSELEQVLKMYPNMWSSANDAAFILADHGKGKKDLDRALTLAQKAQSVNPENPLVLDTLGWVYYKRGELNEAMAWLAKAQTKIPQNPIFNYHIGMVYHQQGNMAKAKEYLQFAAASKTGFDGKDQAQKTLAGIK